MKKMIIIASLFSSVGLIAMDALTQQAEGLEITDDRLAAQVQAFNENAEFVSRLSGVIILTQRLRNTGNLNDMGELIAHTQGLVTLANQMDAQVPADQKKFLDGLWFQALDNLQTALKSLATAEPAESALWIISQLSTLKNKAGTMSKVEFLNSYEVLSELAQGINEGLASHREFKDPIQNINRLVDSLKAQEN